MMRALIAVLCFCFVMGSTTVRAEHGDSLWAGGFTPPGVNGTVQALLFAGDSLLIGGNMSWLGGNFTTINEMVIWNEGDRELQFVKPGALGTGAQVYDFEEVPGLGIVVAGDFENRFGGDTMTNIGVLASGDSWSTLSGASSDGFDGPVRDLLWWQGRLYIGGDFSQAGSLEARGFVVWDSASGDFIQPASQLDPDGIFTGRVNALQLGSGPNGTVIYVGGDIAKAGPYFVNNFVRFNISTMDWETIPGGGLDGTVYALGRAAYYTATSDKIFVGGFFSTAGGQPASNIAIFNTTDETWNIPPVGTNGGVRAIYRPSIVGEYEVYVGGTFDSAGGMFTGPLVAYDMRDTVWKPMNVPIDGYVHSISDAYAGKFAIGGSFDFIGDSALVNNVFLLEQDRYSSDTSWYPAGYGLEEYDSYGVNVIGVAVDSNDNVYAAGNFTHAGGVRVNRVARWDGQQWHGLGDGVNQSPIAIALAGDTLYVAGGVDSAGGIPADQVAMWDGSSWHAMGEGLPFGSPRAAAVDLDGNLWVGGFIDSAGTIPVAGLAMWDGSQWSAPGGLFYRDGTASVAIFDIAVDSVTGDVWVCGQFDGVGGLVSRGVARWDGSTWLPVGDSKLGSPRSIVFAPSGNPVVSTPSSPGLYERVGSDWFGYAGGASTSSGELFTFGCDLYLGGDPLYSVAGQDLGEIARWDGFQWDSLGSGITRGVKGIAATSKDLVIVGDFPKAGGADNFSLGFALWSGLRSPAEAADFAIAAPQPGDTLAYGTVYEILWDTSTTTQIASIEISYDSGMTWQPIHNRADSKRGLLPWLVPDTNAPFCMIRFANGEFPCAVYEPGYTFSIVADSALESWWLTHAGGTYWREPFLPEYNGFSFGNRKGNMWPDSVQESIDYSNFPEPPDSIENFPDWYTFCEAFGDEFCYKNGNHNRIRPKAITRWQSILTKWGGSCLGFSTASLVWLYGNEFNTDLIIPYEPLINLGYIPLTRHAANKHWIYQKGDKHIEHNADARSLTPYETMDLIRDNFTAAFARTLSFSFRSWKDKLKDDSTVIDSIWRAAGHNVVPYAIQNVPDTPGVYYMWYYDSNVPKGRNEWVRIDSINGTWLMPAYYSNDTNCRFIPRLPINEYFGLATDDRVTTGLRKPASSHNAFAYTSASEEVLISDGQGGQVGWANNAEVVSNLDASPIYSDDPDYQYDYPEGYILPAGDYDITLSRFEGRDTRFAWFDDSLTHVYQRQLPDSSESDVIGIGQGLSVINPDSSAKTVSLTTIRTLPLAERYIQVSDWTMTQDDSSSILLDSNSHVVLVNNGSAKAYTFILWNSGDTADSYTQTLQPVVMAAGATHKILPDWEFLESGSADIAVDNDGDGLYEDTVVADVATDVEDDGQGSVLPESYKLAQNYPNPFNPTTTIEYSLPQATHVRLEVINILGRRVATLVDKQLAAGSYAVDWNGRNDTGQPVATGVYFYRIVTDEYTQSRKMLLLK